MMIALRIWRAVAVGTAWRRTAAMPATVGVAKEVPLPTLTVPAPPLPWLKLNDPTATTSGSILPSCVGPRELNSEICMFVSGRNACAQPSTDAIGAVAQGMENCARKMCSCCGLDALPTVRAANEVPGEPIVTDEKPSFPAATAGTISAASNASTA